jgi:hypothetical protein
VGHERVIFINSLRINAGETIDLYHHGPSPFFEIFFRVSGFAPAGTGNLMVRVFSRTHRKKTKTPLGCTFHRCTMYQNILIWDTLTLIFIRWSLKNGNVPLLQRPSEFNLGTTVRTIPRGDNHENHPPGGGPVRDVRSGSFQVRRKKYEGIREERGG